ncbi:efflux transporter outer membrane subunit [Pseudotabrizicola sp. L79]|uniref:efflux transporter outer membrane subunit n=1 Tax=Pseudotabrizicola sp. L79 TaxID=3118402 RepID=UPI002F94B970
MKARSLVIGLLLAGCAVGPDVQRPEVAMQARFVGGDAQAIQALATEQWWLAYNDATLTALVKRGLAQNLDVMAATEAIRQAEAELRATGVNAATSGALAASATRSGGSGASSTVSTNSSTLGASMVIDLFGGIRHARNAAAAALTGAQADAETIRLAWLAELLAAYSNARFYQEALALTRTTITSREQTVEITRTQRDAGAATEYEVAEAQALLSTARASLPQYAALFDANVFAIATLLNEPAGPIMAQMQRGAPQLPVPKGARTGVPADLLRNRPDVRSAEADLAAALATVGVAEAALYPSLTLSGTVGRSDGATDWSFGPQLSLPVFNQGQLRATRDARISAARQAEIRWRAAITGAVEDVQTAQSSLSRYRQQAALLHTAANDHGRALALAQQNYRSGAITLLDLLETDRNTNAARISAASAANDAAQAWATLKIAIGAGSAATGPRSN